CCCGHRGLPSFPTRRSSDLDFQMVRALLKSYEGTPRDAVLFFKDAIAERKFNNEVAAHYGLVAALLRAQDFKGAQAELAELEKTDRKSTRLNSSHLVISYAV